MKQQIARGDGKFCSRHCAGSYRDGKLNANWKGGYLKTLKRAQETKERYRVSNEDRNKAHRLIEKLKHNGEIMVLPCQICGCHSKDKIIEGHHQDYRRPSLVNWLCQTCHHKVHDVVNLLRKEVAIGSYGHWPI